MLTVVDTLHRLGGVGRAHELVAATSRRALDRAVAEGEVVRVARGRYAVPTARDARLAAHGLSGVAVLLSAAAHWGWSTKWQPRRPQVAVPRGRKVPDEVRAQVEVKWRAVAPEDVVDGWVTSPVRTVLDCAALLPFDEALAVADSALRDRTVTRGALLRAAAALRGRGRQKVLRVVRSADAGAANPFESVLRAIALDVPGLTVVTQHRIDDGQGRFIGRVDLADVGLGVVLEAEGFEFHGEPELAERDAVRYNRLVLRGWIVLRFGWRLVMTRPQPVAAALSEAVALRRAQPRARPAS